MLAFWNLGKQLGHGSVARVFEAERLEEGASPEPCVLKVAHDPGEGARIGREAWFTQLAASPYISQVRHFGQIDGQIDEGRLRELEPGFHRGARRFVAFAPRRGRVLRQWLEAPNRNESQRIDMALRVAHDIGSALQSLHSLGIAHGDIKPDNILFDEEGCTLLDMGLAHDMGDQGIEGGTPRYLPLDDPKLGTGRDRDLLALGLTLLELIDPALTEQPHPLGPARERASMTPLGGVIRVLLCQDPGGRASAEWLTRSVLAMKPALAKIASKPGPARVRATYLTLRKEQLLNATSIDADLAPWVAPLVALAQKHRQLNAPHKPHEDDAGAHLEPLSTPQRSAWLARLAGPTALDWPAGLFENLTETTLAKRLTALAAQKAPMLWSLTDLQQALASKALAPTKTVTETTVLLGLRRTPADPLAIDWVETHLTSATAAMRLAAADALRLEGETARAIRLVDGLEEGRVLHATLLRRSGDPEACIALLDETTPTTPQEMNAAACLARAHYDRGDIDRAERALASAARSARGEQVRALLELARGQRKEARLAAETARAMAETPEERARGEATIAFVASSNDIERAIRGFSEAARYAASAGATREEAQYLTGYAASCVDAGELGRAFEAANRAATLFEHGLDRPELASRARLASAAAFALLGRAVECERDALLATRQASLIDDKRTMGFCALLTADVLDIGTPRALQVMQQAMTHLGPLEEPLNDDRLRLGARLLTHDADALGAAVRDRLDAFATSPDTLPAARLEWWSCRAHHAPEPEDAATVLGEIVRCSELTAPVASHGSAAHAGAHLAERLGRQHERQYLEKRRAELAQKLASLATGSGTSRTREWVDAIADDTRQLSSEQVRDLRHLVVALSERGSLDDVLKRVLDVALLWTGAERGILLVPHEAKLHVAASRHIDRRSAEDSEVALSMRLAEQALQSGEPLVAADAMSELGDSHQSVHTLKLRSILVAPLQAREQTVGVLYLDDRFRTGAFGPHELAMTRIATPIAALAIADTQAQTELAKALSEAGESSERLQEDLAREKSKRQIAEQELTAFKARPKNEATAPIIGNSPVLNQLLRLLERVAITDLPVLIRGESGTGKELVARAIAQSSDRREQPFVSENCGALPESLLEATLFGHVKGAFTGADNARIGLFEAAHGGTLFLDEIGEMSPAMQVKVLRVLEDGIVRPVGTTEATKVDVRVIGATHRNLEQMVTEGRFREDLYFRLNVVPVVVPPLRDRLEDVSLLVNHFIEKHGKGRDVRLSPSAEIVMRTFDWPGNIRQLENEVLRALVMADSQIGIEHLSIGEGSEAQAHSPGLDLKFHVNKLEARLIQTALERTGNNQTQAAKLLGVSRYGLHKMIKRLQI